MEEEEIEEEEEEEMEDQEQTKKKDLQQTQKPFACLGRGERECWYETERQSVEERSRRRAWRREGEEDVGRTARWGTKVRCRRTEGGGLPLSPKLPRGLYGPFDLRRSSLLPRSIDTSYSSTADRRHKTLYRDSVEREEEKGRAKKKGNRERIAQTRRRLCSIVSGIYNVCVCMRSVVSTTAQWWTFPMVLYRSAEVR